ncbi:MAG TPA: group III truncated hemoglobin [Chitinophagales bacterium]|nr:group III truncated hemoglobin [Chitinophagales bacterium]HNM32043.1 group III truncated hemoglobin [Chitinophagales bacterium]
MKRDIKNRKDIELLVNTFYKKVKVDKSIGHFFLEVITINWEQHLNTMYNFWENILFFSGGYEGNPINLHRHLNKIENIEKKHFTRWNKLFTETVDELFQGEKADLIKKRGRSISDIIQKNIFIK